MTQVLIHGYLADLQLSGNLSISHGAAEPHLHHATALRRQRRAHHLIEFLQRGLVRPFSLSDLLLIGRIKAEKTLVNTCSAYLVEATVADGLDQISRSCRGSG